MSNEDTQEFYEKNKEIIDRIIAEKEAEKQQARSKEERFREDYLRAMDAAEDLRDALFGFGRAQSEYLDRYGRSEFERMRMHSMLESERFRARMYESRDRFNADFDKMFGFISDPEIQKHVLGAGMELIGAFAALLENGPFPETVKEAVRVSNMVRNEEYCSQNPDCKVRARRTEEPKAGSVKIEVKPKGNDE